jgi:hypothetical protein
MKIPLPSTSRLAEVFEYDATTGMLRWKKRVAYCLRVGQVAGHRRNDGYLDVRLDGAA